MRIESRKQRAARKKKERTVRELQTTIRRLRGNEAAFQLAQDDFSIERVIYEHAALMCHCRALLRELRGDTECRSP